MTDEKEFAGYTIAHNQHPRTSLHGIVEMDDTGFWFRGEKIEDAGVAYHAFLETAQQGGAPELRRELERVTTECSRLQEELQRAKTDRAGWSARSKEDYDRLGKALDPVRRKRSTGEPACSDGKAAEELVTRYNRLREALNCAVEWVRDRGYDDPETAPEWFLSALQEPNNE